MNLKAKFTFKKKNRKWIYFGRKKCAFIIFPHRGPQALHPQFAVEMSGSYRYVLWLTVRTPAGLSVRKLEEVSMDYESAD